MARPKAAVTRLDEAIAAAESAKNKLAGLHQARNKALLGDDDVAALKLAAEIDLAEQTVRGITDKIELLKAEAEREAAERRAKERAALITRIEGKLAERDKIGAELSEAIGRADHLFCRLFKLAGECRAAWPWQPHDALPALLGDQAIVRAVEAEIYRAGARPAVGGGLDKPRPPSFPGGKCPTIELALQPEKIASLGDALREASRFASEIMRTGKATGVVPVASVPIPPEVGGAPSEKSAAELHLAALLAKQNALADDVTPRGDELYAEVLAQIIEVQGEIGRFRALAADGGSK